MIGRRAPIPHCALGNRGAATVKAEEEAAAVVLSDDVTTAGCSDFMAVSKLPLVQRPVRVSKYDTGSAIGRKRQLS